MDRLTERNELPGFLPVLLRGRALGPAYFREERDYQDYADALERLAQYEDIGLSPDEIESQLATYSAVLCDVTNNRMSKTNYTLEAIRSVIHDAQAEDCDRCEDMEHLKQYEEAEAKGLLILLPFDMPGINIVIAERKRQIDLWGDQSDNHPFEWMSILGEEYGELCEAVNETCFRNPKHMERGGIGNIVKEATHVAAVAVAIAEPALKEAIQK